MFSPFLHQVMNGCRRPQPARGAHHGQAVRTASAEAVFGMCGGLVNLVRPHASAPLHNPRTETTIRRVSREFGPVNGKKRNYGEKCLRGPSAAHCGLRRRGRLSFRIAGTLGGCYHESVAMKASYHTLGCKVNQYETERIRLSLENAGFETAVFGAPADVCVINTCSVTSTADAKSRAAIRRAVRANPNALIVITGCLSELERDRVEAIEGVGLVVPNADKASAAHRILSALGGSVSARSSQGSADGAVRLRTRTRALVKVQDGCDHFCAYCVVPYARPVMYSRPVEEVLEELRGLAAEGYKEIVLAGIRLGAYRSGRRTLAGLVLAAADIEGIQRIRLSSIEPWEVGDDLIEAMSHPKVCRHLHIPLQSGDDGVLKAMGRPYDSASYLALADRVRARIDGIGITTDVIVGFPGESEKAFSNSVSLVRNVGFSRLHVFRYSARSRTRAAAMPGQVEEEAKKRRSEEMMEAGREVMRGFALSQVGRVLDVLVEREARAFKRLVGYADNYVEAVFAGSASLKGEIVRVRATGVDDENRVCGTLEWPS